MGTSNDCHQPPKMLDRLEYDPIKDQLTLLDGTVISDPKKAAPLLFEVWLLQQKDHPPQAPEIGQKIPMAAEDDPRPARSTERRKIKAQFECVICGTVFQVSLIPHQCPCCGQTYRYACGPRIVLTDEQMELLRRSYTEGKG